MRTEIIDGVTGYNQSPHEFRPNVRDCMSIFDVQQGVDIKVSIKGDCIHIIVDGIRKVFIVNPTCKTSISFYNDGEEIKVKL